MNTSSGRKALVRGAAWTLAMRWGVRLLGLVNTVVMARILMPSEYGIVAMATIVAGAVQALMDFGPATALLRKSEVDRDFIDSAWTLRVVQGLCILCVLVLLSPFASAYFSEPRVLHVLWTLGVSIAIVSFSSVGPTLAQKSLNFSLDFKIQIISKIAGVATSIGTGLWLRDYRALVIGIAATQVMMTLLSYLFHSYRPRWCTAKIAEIWSVTKWLMLSSIGSFVLRRGDELAAGRIASSSGQFGLYSVGSDLGQMPTSEVGPAMLRALLPFLSNMAGTVQEVNTAVLKVAGATNTVTMPLAFGLAALASPFTDLVLGPNWQEAKAYIAGFAVVGALQSMSGAVTTLLVMRGYTRQHSTVVWIEFCGFIAFAAALVPALALPGLVWARALGAAVGVVGAAVLVWRTCALHPAALLGRLLRPALGALLMFVLVRWVSAWFDRPVPQLAAGVAVGALFYTCWCFLSWRLIGRPDGLEAMVVQWLGQRKAKFVQSR